MRVIPVRHGAPVSAEGTVVQTSDGFALIPGAHWSPEVSTTSTLPPGLGFVVPLAGALDAVSGNHVDVVGTWTGTAIDVSSTKPAPAKPPASAPERFGLRARPADVPGPPGELERRLLDDGTITDRCPYFDGTLRVAADDVDLVTRLLTPLYGDRLQLARAIFPQTERRVAEAATRRARSLEVVCAWGTAPLDDAVPVETVHTLEAGWVTEALADVLAPVADGLVRLTSHVEVLGGRA